MKKKNDFHVHSCLSDGVFAPDQLCLRAKEIGISLLAITDHDMTHDLTKLRDENKELTLIQGAEISCLHDSNQYHFLALGFDPNNAEMKAIFEHNQPDREPYISAILKRLRDECNIDLGSFDSVCEQFPERERKIGRKQLACLLKFYGHCNTVDEGFHRFIGKYGERRAYVPNPHQFVSLEKTVTSIINSGGVAIWAHPLKSRLSTRENEKFCQYLKELGGDRVGIEAYYSSFSEYDRQYCRALGDKYNMLTSCGSDYHGHDGQQKWLPEFSSDLCRPLLEILGIY